MATFGSFETDREVYSGPTYTVYSGRKPGDSGTNYAIKVFSLRRIEVGLEPATELDPLMSDLERSCRDRIAVQQRAAAASTFVSNIFETGQDERGVWYVTRFYPRSVNRIISGRVALSRDALHHILRAMAQGALDIKRTCGRSHGDIEPSNVQISRSDNMLEAEVVLSDPLPGHEAEARLYELSDLRAIGRILLQLVLQRQISNEEDFLILPILSSPNWTKLFRKDADRWLALCNRLLDPNLSLEQFTLEQLVEELEQLRSKPPVSRGVILAVAAAVVVLGIAAVFAAMYFNRGRLLITTDPPGAEVRLEVEGKPESLGKTPLDRTPLLTKRLPKGPYKLRAEYPGLAEQVEAVTIEGGKTRPYQFAFSYGLVRITSNPTNAAVELDGKAVGFTPYDSPVLKPGEATFYVRSAGYHVSKLNVVVPADRKLVITNAGLVLAPVNAGYIEFDSQPKKVKISEAGIQFGETPLPKTLPAGAHKITAQFEDWPPVTEEVVVRPGDNPPKVFYLPHGIARFSVTPSDAEIFLNDKPMGRDLRQKALQPGQYILRATRAGYEPFTNKFSILDRQATPIEFSLKAMLGFVEFTTDPPGAAVFDASAPLKELGRTQPGQALTRSFQPGTYTFLATHEGLDEVRSKPVRVAMGTNIALVLSFKYGSVRFDSDPSGADVLIGGKRAGQTPYVHRQKPGPIAYRVEMADYYPEEGNRELSTGAAQPVSLRLRPRDVRLVLQSDPPGAQFFRGDLPLSGTNGFFSVPWGTNTIIATYQGLEPMTNSVVVDKRGATALKFEFDYATLHITNVDSDATLLFQNKPVGNFPARLYLKPEAQYDFVIEYGGDFRTNLPVKLARKQAFTPFIVLPELRKTYSNSIGMVLIRVSKDLYAGKFEVTDWEYQKIMTGSEQGNRLQPAVNVKWADALKCCDALSDRDKESLARQKLAGWRYALPTDQEWMTFAEPSASVLNASLFSGSARQVPAPIDPNRKSATALGIYDLFGNAAEWCRGASDQPMTMGGSIFNLKPRLEAALARLRDVNVPPDAIASGSPVIGFRFVLKPPPQ